MKWTVQRYVLREVVQTWLAVTGVLVAILVSNQLSRVLGQAADNQYGRRVVFDLIALGAVMNLSVIVPVGRCWPWCSPWGACTTTAKWPRCRPAASGPRDCLRLYSVSPP